MANGKEKGFPMAGGRGVAIGGTDVSRRAFLAGGLTAALAAASRGADAIPRLSVAKAIVKAGLRRSVSLLHVSDSHLLKIDSREDAAVQAFFLKRSRMGRELGECYLDEAVAHARSRGLPIVHTGDLLEVNTAAGRDYFARRFATDRFLACPGNHEYWTTSSQVDAVRRDEVAPGLRALFGGECATLRLDGLTVFAFDNADETVSPATLAAFRRVLAEGQPVVLACHVPFLVAAYRQRYAWLRGGAASEFKPHATTDAFVALAKRSPLVKAVLCGHVHCAVRGVFSPSADLITADALFRGSATEIEFI